MWPSVPRGSHPGRFHSAGGALRDDGGAGRECLLRGGLQRWTGREPLPPSAERPERPSGDRRTGRLPPASSVLSAGPARPAADGPGHHRRPGWDHLRHAGLPAARPGLPENRSSVIGSRLLWAAAGFALAATLPAAPTASGAPARPRVAFIVESWYPHSHADVIGTRLLEGYRVGGRGDAAAATGASAHAVAPRPSDQTRALAARYGLRLPRSAAPAPP